MSQTEKATHWAVVGGGILGIAAALELRLRGERVTLIEAGETIGGLTAAWQIGDIVWDKYYHVTLLSDSHTRALLAQIGLDEKIQWVQTKTGFYSDGKLHSMSSSVEFLKFPILKLLQKLRLGGTIFLGSKIRNWRAMEQIPVERWLRKWSGNSTFEKVWQPLLRAKLGDAYKRTSAAFIWAYIDRMYKARRSGMKREMFGYVPGGYAEVLNGLVRLLKERGVEIQTSAPVQRVCYSDSERKISIQFGQTDKVATQSFDRVLMTAACPVIAKTCSDLNQVERDKLQAVEYLGVICTSLLLKNSLGDYYVTNITDAWVPLTGIIEMGSLVPPAQMGGHYLVYLPQYMTAEDPRFGESDETIHERCLATLEKMYPHFSRDQVSAIQTTRAKHVMAIPTINYSVNLPPLVTSVPGLYLLNSARIVKGTLNVNESLELLDQELNETVWPDHQYLTDMETKKPAPFVPHAPSGY